MQIDLATGLLDVADYIPSPNHDDRPASCDIELLVIHNISLPPKEYGGPFIEQLFSNCLDPQDHPYFADICHLKVSSHLLIRRDGQILQFVPFHKRAWHAGESCFKERVRCNDFSIGIELEGSDEEAYEDIQYQQLLAVTRLLRQAYPGIGDNIVGHEDIAPGRKTDPGPAFDWAGFRQKLASV